MTFENLKKIYSDNGCQQIFVKTLSPNDNSKNQVYLGGSFDILNIFPITEITTDSSGDWERERFKATLNFCWISEEGNLYNAPRSQLILYPKYPEVRFSGFLQGCEIAPSELMTVRLADRLLFLGVSDSGKVLGFVVSPESVIANEFNSMIANYQEHGVFKVVVLPSAINDREKLIKELRRIHELEWITSKRLDGEGNTLPCLSSNCGGYTLEAELGITPNGYSEPDFLGWEVKQFSVKNFNKIESSVITLMTPEPNAGFYVTSGINNFIRKYGYKDKTGRPDRINFGGVHKVGIQQQSTKLTMILDGFDGEEGKIRSSNGKISLIDLQGNEAASWSFSSLILHWNRKHNKACYVPSLSEKEPALKYRYGNKVILGNGTDFQLFLNQMSMGNIYYDPGIKLENASGEGKTKRRSQFRMKSKFINSLYRKNETIDVLK
jgi:hypothetical protein